MYELPADIAGVNSSKSISVISFCDAAYCLQLNFYSIVVCGDVVNICTYNMRGKTEVGKGLSVGNICIYNMRGKTEVGKGLSIQWVLITFW